MQNDLELSGELVDEFLRTFNFDLSSDHADDSCNPSLYRWIILRVSTSYI